MMPLTQLKDTISEIVVDNLPPEEVDLLSTPSSGAVDESVLMAIDQLEWMLESAVEAITRRNHCRMGQQALSTEIEESRDLKDDRIDQYNAL